MLDPYFALERAAYPMITNFGEGVPYVHSSVRNLCWDEFSHM